MAVQTQSPPPPVVLDIAYPEKLSRWKVALKLLLGWLYVGIPHGIILYLYGVLVGLLTLFAFFAILFTGRYPKGIFDLVVGYYRWSTRVNAYLGLLRDEYPPFTNK